MALFSIDALTYSLILASAMAVHDSAERPREKLRVEELSSAAVSELMRNRVSLSFCVIVYSSTLSWGWQQYFDIATPSSLVEHGICHKCMLSPGQASQRAKGLLRQARIEAKRLESSRRNVKLVTMTLYGD